MSALHTTTEYGLIICKECGQAIKSITDCHLAKCSGITLEEYHRRYDPVAYHADILADFLEKYYILNRTKFLSYYYDRKKGSLVAKTINIKTDPFRNCCLIRHDILKHVNNKGLIGVCFDKCLRKFMAIDIDTANYKVLWQVSDILFKLGIDENNFLISRSGPTNHHVEVLFDCVMFLNQSQDLFDYIHSQLILAPGEKVECRSGKSAQGYKLPLGSTYKEHVDAKLSACSSYGDEISYDDEIDFLSSKRGLTAEELKEVFKKAGLKEFVPVRKLTPEEQEAREIRKAMWKAQQKVEQFKKQREKEKKKAEKEKWRAEERRLGIENVVKSNLYYTYRHNAIARCSDMEKLILLRGGDLDGMRNDLLFCYAVSYKATFTTRDRLHRELIRVNNLFEHPEDESKLDDTVNHALDPEMHQFKTETILSWLQITDEEQQEMDVLRCQLIRIERKNQRRRDTYGNRADVIERKKQREERLTEVAELLEAGWTCCQIGIKYDLSRRTIERYRREIETRLNRNVEEKKQSCGRKIVAAQEPLVNTELYIHSTGNVCLFPESAYAETSDPVDRTYHSAPKPTLKTNIEARETPYQTRQYR